MALQRIDFRPVAQGGDVPTAALKKLDENDADLDNRKLGKEGGTVTGSVKVGGRLSVGGTHDAAGSLDILSDNGRILVRDVSSVPCLDGVNKDNSGFGEIGIAATALHIISRSGDSQTLFRVSSGQATMDSVNGGNNAFRPQNFTASSFGFNGGDITVNGNVRATGTVSWSDERLKWHIENVSVTRGMALALAQEFQEWDLISNGYHDFGVTAQKALKICPRWVRPDIYTPAPVYKPGTTELADVQPEPVERLNIDKPGMALEASMDNALGIEELRQALAAALVRIEALEVR